MSIEEESIETIKAEEFPKVIQNSDYLYKSDIKWIDPNIETPEPSEYEKITNKNSKTPSQLLEEEKNEVKPEYTEEEQLKIKRREYITKVKVIALDLMSKHPLANPSNFSFREKDKLLKHMESLTLKSEDEITELFNVICVDKIFSPTADYSTYPIYNKVM